MRKIIVLSMITLDGVLQAPGGPEEDTSGHFLWASSICLMSAFEINLPFRMTANIFCVLLISNKGLSSRIKRSASFPVVTVPISFSLYKNLAGLIVAVCRAWRLVRPASRKLINSCCNPNPGTQNGLLTSVPARINTPLFIRNLAAAPND